MNGGTVIYIGEKVGYNRVVIVQDDDGVNYWYGNMCNINLRLYDSVNLGDYIGNVCGNYMYMVYSQENKYLDYRDYLK